ncbi:hypothetical protein AB0C11_33740 [Streptomyces sp. NPDC039016]|uniref:hypothetical protein n=1 Tax=Streptomyces sp. NPDC039016 TaxID=3154330 RepID=UPI0033D11E7A
MNNSPGVQLLAEELGVEAEHIAHALEIATDTLAAVHTSRIADMTAQQYRRLNRRDHHAVAIVANLAMRHAGRIDDAHTLMSVYKTSAGINPHHTISRKGVGTRPEHHSHTYVQQVIRILQAADLPPVHTDGTRELRPGFRIIPGCEQLPGWVYIAPDPDCDSRSGFAGGRRGYLRVMRWAKWGVIDQPITDDLWAAVHPDHLTKPNPS